MEKGQEVICIKSHPEGVVLKGNTYIVKGLDMCTCGLSLDVGIKHSDFCLYHCNNCFRDLGVTDTWWLCHSRFIPKSEITELEVLHQEKEIAELLTVD